MRGNSHPMICRHGSPLDGIRSIAFLAKGLACSSVCRLSFGSDIHSRMSFRRVSCSGFMLKILCVKRRQRARDRCAARKGDEIAWLMQLTRVLMLVGKGSLPHSYENHITPQT